jgi:hypothetical protein
MKKKNCNVNKSLNLNTIKTSNILKNTTEKLFQCVISTINFGSKNGRLKK